MLVAKQLHSGLRRVQVVTRACSHAPPLKEQGGPRDGYSLVRKNYKSL